MALKVLVTKGVSYDDRISVVSQLLAFIVCYLAIVQLFRHHVCAHFGCVDLIAAMLCMSPHSTRPRSLIESIGDLFRRKWKPPETG